MREAWRSFELERMCRYPHSRAIHDEVVRYWADYAFIEPGNVVPTDGSISALSDRDFPPRTRLSSPRQSVRSGPPWARAFPCAIRTTACPSAP